MNSFEEMKKKLEDRGYSRVDIKEIQNRVNEERRMWIRKFDDYVDQLNYQCENMPVETIITRAEKLADARQAVIDCRFPEGTELDVLNVDED